MIRTLKSIALLTFITYSLLVQAQTVLPLTTIKFAAISSTKSKPAPTRTLQLLFNKEGINQAGFSLKGIQPEQEIEFTVRKDEIVTKALLKLQFTPSPSLIPIESQLKVYLNNELMGVITITSAQLGKSSAVEIPLDPLYISDFNKLKLSFIGHYKEICENPVNSTLWLDVSQSSSLELTLQTLELSNNLVNFPEPFFDPQDRRPLKLPMVFSGPPTIQQQKAAAILASWFGIKADWKGQSFPAFFNQLPTSNAIVFATNTLRPAFLNQHKTVNAPTIEIINHPENPYVKLLLILGRDDRDLITAAKGIAQGNVLFRGGSVVIDKVEMIESRHPYDAPNWVRTDRPTTFVELQKYKEQLQTSGVNPYPISLNFNLPPDLYLFGSHGIELFLKYRYSPPPSLTGSSHLNIGLNNYFVKSYDLIPGNEEESSISQLASLPHLIGYDRKITIPVLQLGPNNQLNFNFDYTATVGGGTIDGHCQSFTLINNYAAIDGSSSIDFSNYYHYIAMPNLSVFAKAGFPFSRMADLSETGILVKQAPQPDEVSTLLDVAGNMGAQTGYPALSVTITDSWDTLKKKNKDILIIGDIPPDLQVNTQMSLFLQQPQSWVKEPIKQLALHLFPEEEINTTANTKTWVKGNAPIAAIIGIQSPFYKQRSIVALLAENPHDFELLNDALTDTKKQSQLFGTVSIIRASGINSIQVGQIYHIGHLPWWLRIWFALQTHPISLAIASLFTALLISILAWHGLVIVSRRRLKKKERE